MFIFLFILILFVLVLIHEFGHFIVAKKSGIRVDEFGFGFPPRILTLFTKGDTRYTLNWIPFGGFVKIFGENPDDESLNGPDKDRSFISKPKYTQAMVLLAGVVFNALFAWLLLSAGFMTGLPTSVGAEPTGTQVVDAHLTLTSIKADSPADKAGLKVGDRVLALDTVGQHMDNPTPESLKSFVAQYGDKLITLSIARGPETKSITVQPELGVVDGAGRGIGVSMDVIGILKLGFGQALFQGGKLTVSLLKGTAVGLYTLVAGLVHGTGGLSDVTGPIGIVGYVKDAYQFGFVYLLSFTALISINLAIINLVPFPALDGGRLLFLLIESITRRQIPPKFSNIANAIGFFILIALMLLITYHDILHLIHK